MGEIRGCCNQVHLAHEKAGLEDQLSVLLVTTHGYLTNSNYNTSVLENNNNTQCIYFKTEKLPKFQTSSFRKGSDIQVPVKLKLFLCTL